MIGNILVLGAGSAGLLAALSLKIKIPQLAIRIVRSPEIGVIGVGESTTPNFPRHLFEYLGISRRYFYAHAEPTWKMGIHFLWGPRRSFNYGFEQQLDAHWDDLPRSNGYYCDDDFEAIGLNSSLMSYGKVFPRQEDGGPAIPPWHAFHIENHKLVQTLENLARGLGIEIIDAKVKGAQRGPEGIGAVILDDGRRLNADLYIDASGFRGELLSRTLEEPFVSFSPSLFSDRAIVGNWARAEEPILPYTTAETMDSGWCWRIDHEHSINRGYVYASSAISDDEARAEFMRKNPRVNTWDHVVKFRSGRLERAWVGNVMAIGNACGFVEPLESTALMATCWQCQTFVDFLLHSGLEPTPSFKGLFNTKWSETWDELRDFLTLHYWANTRLETPFWRRVRGETDISRLRELLHFFDENGPTGYCRYLLKNTGSQFGVEGFLVMLVGNRVPYRGKHEATPVEREIWRKHCAGLQELARGGLDVREALATIRNPRWQWADEGGLAPATPAMAAPPRA